MIDACKGFGSTYSSKKLENCVWYLQSGFKQRGPVGISCKCMEDWGWIAKNAGNEVCGIKVISNIYKNKGTSGLRIVNTDIGFLSGISVVENDANKIANENMQMSPISKIKENFKRLPKTLLLQLDNCGFENQN